MTKYELLSLSDADFLKQCRFEARRGTGPGGQKRNKTSTATRVTHVESGLSATDDVSRSQHQNLSHAIFKLRCELAVTLRPSAGEIPLALPLEPIPKISSSAYILWLGRLFDVLQSHDFQLSESACALGLTGSQLARLLSKDEFAWQKTAEARQRLRLPPLHR